MAAEVLQGDAAVLSTVRRALRLVTLRPRLSRYVFWRSCQLLGLLRRRFVSGRRKLFTVLALAAGGVVAAWQWRWHVGKHGLWSAFGKLLAIWLLGSFLLLLWQARRRVVVEQFTD